MENNTSVEGLDGDALVSAITEELIMKASEFPGVQVPPSQEG